MQVKGERDDLHDKFVSAVLDLQQKAGMKNMILEKKLVSLEEMLEKRDVQLAEAMSAANLDKKTMRTINQKLEVLMNSTVIIYSYVLCLSVIILTNSIISYIMKILRNLEGFVLDAACVDQVLRNVGSKILILCGDTDASSNLHETLFHSFYRVQFSLMGDNLVILKLICLNQHFSIAVCEYSLYSHDMQIIHIR